jgi:predicted tellurium resistance membrane protein TerC
LAIILAFVGVKMIAGDYIGLSNWLSLLFVLVVLGVTILVSMIVTRRRDRIANGA